MNDGNRKRPKQGDAGKQNRQNNSNQADGDNNEGKGNGKTSPQPQPTIAQQEQEQAKQQWLKRIPDEPGGLLREKFYRDYQRRQQVRG